MLLAPLADQAGGLVMALGETGLKEVACYRIDF
jgi:hypothetical protein